MVYEVLCENFVNCRTLRCNCIVSRSTYAHGLELEVERRPKNEIKSRMILLEHSLSGDGVRSDMIPSKISDGFVRRDN